MAVGDPALEARLRAVEQAVAELRGDGRPGESAPDAARSDDPLWALTELERRAPGAVVVAGSVEVPESGPVRWQNAVHGEALLDRDWGGLAGTLDALAHPARLAILQLVLTGVRATAQLLEQESVGTSGQLHHHVRQLVAAGWLVSTGRGHYEVPGPRVVPLLVIVLAAVR